MQFSDLDPVLAEVKRVLKPGGLAGFREMDFGASLYHSDTSALREARSILRRVTLHNDENPDLGRVLPGILAHAGFEILSAVATFSCPPTPQAKARLYGVTAQLWEQGEFVAQAEALGWIDAAGRSAMLERLKREGADPASFSGMAHAEVVARMVTLE